MLARCIGPGQWPGYISQALCIDSLMESVLLTPALDDDSVAYASPHISIDIHIWIAILTGRDCYLYTATSSKRRESL